jgi:hypothetical protein
MVKEKKTKLNLKTERIDIRCTPKQKQIFMNYGGSALVIKMIDKIAEQMEEQKSKHK